MRVLVFSGLGLLLAACGQEHETPQPEPTSFYIFRDDLAADQPADVCRSRDPEFLDRLLNRVKSALRPEQLASFKFEDFNVPESRDSAVLRFFISLPREGPVMHFASGTFDVDTCSFYDLEIGRGVHPLEDPGGKRVPVP